MHIYLQMLYTHTYIYIVLIDDIDILDVSSSILALGRTHGTFGRGGVGSLHCLGRGSSACYKGPLVVVVERA